MTGHGCFQSYLFKFGKADDRNCWYCNYENDDAEHTVLKCLKWERLRQRTEEQVQTPLNKENIVKTMLKSEKNFILIKEMIGEIMREKEKDERKRQKENR